jgi:hypothetical protein
VEGRGERGGGRRRRTEGGRRTFWVQEGVIGLEGVGVVLVGFSSHLEHHTPISGRRGRREKGGWVGWKREWAE